MANTAARTMPSEENYTDTAAYITIAASWFENLPH